MSAHKAVVARYFDGFRRSDHEEVLACLDDDVVWDLPGFKHLRGKEAYDREIENEDFVGPPMLNVDRLIEEGDVVVAIGTGASTRTDGTAFRFSFCDVFTFAGELVRRCESYIVPLSPLD